jgi:hypothetical protein
MGKPARATTRAARKRNSSVAKPDGGSVVEAGDAGNPETGSGDSGDSADLRNGSVIDPGTIGSAADTGSGDSATGNIDPTTGKRRYKRRASKAADAVSLDLGSFKDILYSTHAMLASIASAPGMAIDEDEAEKLAKAVANVSRHYDIPTMAQTTVDWVMLIQACGAIYGPRLLAWKMDRAAKRARPAPQSPMAPRNVAPAPTAPNVQQPETAAMASPGVSSRTTPPPNVMSNASAPVRNQPGLDTLDGAGSPLKIN